MKKITLYYPDIDFHYDVEIWKDEFIEYLWEREFNTEFNILTYLLDDKGGLVYNKLEDKWLHNELDEDSIVKDPSFEEFLSNRFKDTAYWRYEAMEELKEKLEKKNEIADKQLEEVFNYVNTMVKEGYDELTPEELEEIFLENFGGEI